MVASHLSSKIQITNATHLITIMDKECSDTKQYKYYTNINTRKLLIYNLATHTAKPLNKNLPHFLYFYNPLLMAATDVPKSGLLSISHTQTTFPFTTTAHINFIRNYKLRIYRIRIKHLQLSYKTGTFYVET